MENLSKLELIEICAGNPEAYAAGHEVGDFIGDVLKGIGILKLLSAFL